MWIDARLYFVSIFVGLLTGCVAVPYHYLLGRMFEWRRAFFGESHPWYEHLSLCLLLWGALLLAAALVRRMPLITGGGIPQTRAANNGRIRYEHPFRELAAKFAGGVLALGAGLSLGREGPSVQMGSYVGTLVSRHGRIPMGERKQLLAAGAGAGLAAAFDAPLSSSLLVIEAVERFDAPKTAIVTLLAGVVAGGVAGGLFPVNPYRSVSVSLPALSFPGEVLLYVGFAAFMAMVAKGYSLTVRLMDGKWRRVFRWPVPLRTGCLLLTAYAISLVEVDLTGGGEPFLAAQCMDGSYQVGWLVVVLLIHFFFTLLSLESGLPGGSFVPTLVTGGLLGRVFGLVAESCGWIGNEHLGALMLVGMVAFLVAVVRTPLTAMVLVTEMTGHFEVFFPSVVVGGLTYYFTELLRIKPANVRLYDRMFRGSSPEFPLTEGARCSLFVEIMQGSYLDGKTADCLSLPGGCVLRSIRRGEKHLLPRGQTLASGDQVEIEMDAEDVEKLYEPLVSLANIY